MSGLTVSLSTVYLAAIGLVHHKHFAPDLNSRGLSFAASSPGEPSQRFIITSHPRLTLQQRERGGGGKKRERQMKYILYVILYFHNLHYRKELCINNLSSISNVD